MIQFTLKCEHGHRFDSWFKSAEAYEALKRSGHLACAECGSAAVDKAIMAPRVHTARRSAQPETAPREAEAPDTPAPDKRSPEEVLAALRKHVEANSDYVGMNFAREARDIHDGIAPERPIYGEAKPDEARKLIEDGVPVAPLPFIPTRKTN